MKISKKDYYLIKFIIKNLILLKGINIKIIDTRKKNNLFNYFIICEGTSNLHIKSIYNKIEMSIYKKYKIRPYNIEGQTNCKWILIDYVFFIVNIFLDKIRYYYKIDKFFKNFPIIDVLNKKIYFK
ncbi:MAG: ribosome silencing factor [Candidatus Shikimatogenerans bostrichidophilus]|nr:MAG: ribosome silencing factor [Candidatus Shikimatogenerans bostrichidophilus]